MEQVNNTSKNRKTNLKYLSVVIILALVAGAGIFYISKLSEIPQPSPIPSPLAKHPVLILAGEYTKEGEYYKVFVSGDYAYATRGQDMHIYDISNPTEPKLVGKYVHPTPLSHGQPMINHAFVSGNYAYLSTDDSFQIVDVSDKSNPKLVGIYDRTKDEEIFFRQSFVNNGYAYIANGSYGVSLLDISNPEKTILINKYRIKNPNSSNALEDYFGADAIFLRDNLIYVLDYISGLSITDISNPKNPVLLNTYHASSCQGFYVEGNRVYIVKEQNSGNSIEIVDISNPLSPVLIRSYNDSKEAQDIYIYNNYAYITNGWSGLDIVNISNPDKPTFIANYQTGIGKGYDRLFMDISIIDNYLYAATGGGLVIFKIEYK